MPRKTKDIKKIEEKDEKVTKPKKSAGSKASVSSNNATKKDKKETKTKKATTAKTKKETKSSKVAKKSDAKTKKSTSKKVKTSKNAEKKATTKKSTTKTKTTTKKEKTIIEPVEYYDLPYRYNQTVVKLLAQTPNNLFIYWDISDEDREKYKKTYGENFFEQTKPVLIVHNKTMNYSFEVDINDFANSWYLHVNDSKCDYTIELGRRPIVRNQEINQKIPNNYIYISSSNNIESPNDKILFNANSETVYFKNVKTNSLEQKSVSRLSFMPHLHKMAKIYNVYDLYKEFYKDENLEDVFNPSSSNPSSDSFTSRFM